VVFKNLSTPRIKISRLYLRKKLAGIALLGLAIELIREPIYTALTHLEADKSRIENKENNENK